MMFSQQKRDIKPMLGQCCSAVYDTGATLGRYLVFAGFIVGLCLFVPGNMSYVNNFVDIPHFISIPNPKNIDYLYGGTLADQNDPIRRNGPLNVKLKSFEFGYDPRPYQLVY